MAEKSKEPEGIGQEIETEGGEVKFEPVKKIEEDGLLLLQTYNFSTQRHW